MGVVQHIKNILLPPLLSEEVLYSHVRAALTKEDGTLYTLSQLLERAARLFPDTVALVYEQNNITYRELYFRALCLSVKLKAEGIEQGDTVLMLFENSPEFYIVYFAILQVGAICVPLNIFLHEKELGYIIGDALPKLLIASTTFKDKIESLKTRAASETFPPVFFETCIDWSSAVPQTHEAMEKIFTPAHPNEHECALLLYTSGTTGVPKGVMLSSHNVISNTMQCAARLGYLTRVSAPLPKIFSLKERFFAALPLFHVFAQNTCIWFPFLVGGSVIVVPRIDRREILEGLKQKPTLFFGVPALYGLLSLLKTAPLESVKFFVSGGDAMPDKIRGAFAMIYGRKICSGYGLTEASPVISVNIENEESATNVVGVPLHGIQIDIRDDEGLTLSPGKVGTLWVRGDNVMKGYYKAPEETAKVLKNGWLNTGDLARVNAKNGKIAIIGRMKDLIIHKGFNIYPQEVENILLSHPAIFQAAVVGRDDATVGQVPVAYVSLKPDHTKLVDVDKVLRDFCSNYLASYKIPRKFVCLDGLPLNATGKVDKKRLQID